MTNRPSYFAQLNLQIRPATIEDWAVIAKFNTCLALETEGKKLKPELIEAGVQNLLANPQFGRYFVACLQGQIIGQMMYTVEWSDWRNGQIWWLQSVYVDDNFRRKGVFTALFNYLNNLARSTPGVVGIRLYAERNNRSAFAAYERLGLLQTDYQVLENIFVSWEHD